MKFERRQYGRNHAYYLDGGKLDGVTTILGTDNFPAPALINWSANATAQYAVDNWDELALLGPAARYEVLKASRYRVSDAAKLRGTEIHELAHHLVMGDDVEVPDALRDPVDALAALMDKIEMEPVLRETPVLHSEHRWGGTTDVTALIGGELWLLDYKSGKGLYDKDALQVAAYANATHHLDGDTLVAWERPARVGLIHVRPDVATLHEVTDVAALYEVFRHVHYLARTLPTIPNQIGDPL